MIRFRWYYDKEKETIWLNQMAHEGWAMVHFFLGFYWFERCRPGEYLYQIDLFFQLAAKNCSFISQAEYVNLIEETGAEYIGRWGWYRFFRRRAELGGFALYTDVDSQAEQYRRYLRFFRTLGILAAGICLYEICCCYTIGNQSGSGRLFFLAAVVVVLLIAGVIWGMYFRIRRKIKKLEQELL